MKRFERVSYRLIFALVGFTAVIAQVLFMREFLAVLNGNEISIGIILTNWLLWTAAGSYLAGRWLKKQGAELFVFGIFQFLLSLALTGTLIAIRFCRSVFGALPGEMLGIVSIYIISLALLGVFCLISGALFAMAGIIFTHKLTQSMALSSSRVYLLETLGSAAGGILLSFFLIPLFSNLQICLMLSMINCITAFYFIFEAPAKKVYLFLSLIIITVYLILFYFSNTVDSYTRGYQWKNFVLLKSIDSRYGNLSVVELEQSRSLFHNGVPAFTVPDKAAAEEGVHYALIQHPEPKSVLLIGGAFSGYLPEILKHQSVASVDVVEIDPKMIALADSFFHKQYALAVHHPRISLHKMDGRLFLEKTKLTFDLILTHLPDPQNMQINRYYTLEFFRTVASKLNSGGIFSFQTTASENYISSVLAEYLSCLNKSLNFAFKAVGFIPGNTVHYFASVDTTVFNIDPEVMLERLHARNIETQYIREYYIPFRLMPDRVSYLKNTIDYSQATPLNTDVKPTAYFLNTILWSSQFFPNLQKVLLLVNQPSISVLILIIIVIMLVVAILPGWFLSVKKKMLYTVSFAVLMTGFSVMVLEILILLCFQTILGYVYHQIAILIAAFMSGMGLGSWRALHFRKQAETAGLIKRLVVVHLFFVAVPFVIPLLFGIESDQFLLAVFPLLAAISGAIGGYQFPLASRIYFETQGKDKSNIGILYSIDLVGAFVGALIISVMIIPLFGMIITALLVSLVNLIVLFSLNRSIKV